MDTLSFAGFGLRFVVVAYLGHTHLLFCRNIFAIHVNILLLIKYDDMV